MRFKSIFIVLSIIPFIQFSSYSQDLTIQVIDFQSKRHLFKAKVEIDEVPRIVAHTDQYGNAYFRKVPEGRITIRVYKEGYLYNVEKNVIVRTSGKVNKKIIEITKVPEEGEYLFYGEIRDIDNEDINGAKVELKLHSNVKSTSTDSSGNYFFSMPESELKGTLNYRIEIKNDGCEIEDFEGQLPISKYVENDFMIECNNSMELKGVVLDSKSNSPVSNANVKILSTNNILIKDIITSESGHFVAKGLQINQQFIIQVDAKGYNNLKLKRKIDELNGENNIRIHLKKEVNSILSFSKKYSKTIFTSIIGTGLIIGGSISFVKGKTLHDDYERYTDELKFITVRPEFENRYSAYKKAESLRKFSTWSIPIGIAITALSQTWIRKSEKEKFNNESEVGNLSFINRLRFEVSSTEFSIALQF